MQRQWANKGHKMVQNILENDEKQNFKMTNLLYSFRK